MPASLVVGFDLDLTLLDSRPGVAATYRALSAAIGVHIDAELAASRLGPPLETELANWLPADRWGRPVPSSARSTSGTASNPRRCSPVRPRRSRASTPTAARSW
jgi:FMN phosphatase YigB (HAD superfamily)